MDSKNISEVVIYSNFLNRKDIIHNVMKNSNFLVLFLFFRRRFFMSKLNIEVVK